MMSSANEETLHCEQSSDERPVALLSRPINEMVNWIRDGNVSNHTESSELAKLVLAVAERFADVDVRNSQWDANLVVASGIVPPNRDPSGFARKVWGSLQAEGSQLYGVIAYALAKVDTNDHRAIFCSLSADYGTVSAIATFRSTIRGAFPNQTVKVFLATADQGNDLSISVVNTSQEIVAKGIDGVFVFNRRVVARGNILKPHRIVECLKS